MRLDGGTFRVRIKGARRMDSNERGGSIVGRWCACLEVSLWGARAQDSSLGCAAARLGFQLVVAGSPGGISLACAVLEIAR
eukprot:1298399-Pyramimonas_sp.AAC.1